MAYHAKKRFGQNFLKSPAIISKIVDQLDKSKDLPVIEIGPGRGALTLELAQNDFAVTAVEFDNDLIGYLKKLLQKFPKVTLLHHDFLSHTPEQERFQLIGNIPYNLTSPVIDWAIGHHSKIERAVLMVQKELAERLAAGHHSKNWSPLSIFTQLYFEVELCFDVAPKHFSPPPKVTSSVIRLVSKEEIKIKQFNLFENIVRSSFTQRRKLLINNLCPKIIPERKTAEKIFEQLGFAPGIRAEEVSIEQFLKLTDMVAMGKFLADQN